MEIQKIYDCFIKSTGVSTDTRQIKPGNIYFALKGPSFNGNTYAADAVAKGAIMAVVDEQDVAVNEHYIYVNDVLTTLQQVANYHRKALKTTIIGVCGSNGKTTTKELIHKVLSTQFKTFATKGNLNNHIGVPLSLLSIENDTDYAVIEMGANHLGETAELCRIAEPDYGIITNNGYDHLEGYGSLENVAKANGELYDFLRSHNSIAFVNADDADLLHMSTGLKRVTYGVNGDINGTISAHYPYLSVSVQGSTIATRLAGDYNFPNVMCAVCIGKQFGVADANIEVGISSYMPQNNRSQLLKVDSNTFIVDCYNANPSSMDVALKYFHTLPYKNKIVILGDMFELGDMSAELHRQILTLVRTLQFDDVLLVGNRFATASTELAYNYKTFVSTAEAKTWFQSQHYTDTAILLKASRGMALETLLA